MLLGIIGFIAIELILRGMGLSTAAAAIISVCAILAFIPAAHIVKDLTLDAFIKKERKKQRLKMCKMRLLLLESAEFKERARELAKHENTGDFLLVPYQRQRAIDQDDISAAVRCARAVGKKSVVIVSLSDEDEALKAFIAAAQAESGVEISFCGSEKLLNYELEKRPVSDAEADRAFIDGEAMEKRAKQGFFKRIKLQRDAAPFFICAAILFVLSFIMRFPLLYRLLAATSMWLGVGKVVIKRMKKDAR